MCVIGVLKASPLRLSPRLALHACTGLGQEILSKNVAHNLSSRPTAPPGGEDSLIPSSSPYYTHVIVDWVAPHSLRELADEWREAARRLHAGAHLEVPGQSCSGEPVTNFGPAFHARSSARRNSLRAFSERSRGVSSASDDCPSHLSACGRKKCSGGWILPPPGRPVDGAPLAHPLSDRCRP
jgi:hypothetical protein